MKRLFNILCHKRITCWIRWHEPKDDKPGYWAHNHISDGWQECSKPVLLVPWSHESPIAQQVWETQTWKKKHAILTKDLKVIEL